MKEEVHSIKFWNTFKEIRKRITLINSSILYGKVCKEKNKNSLVIFI